MQFCVVGGISTLLLKYNNTVIRYIELRTLAIQQRTQQSYLYFTHDTLDDALYSNKMQEPTYALVSLPGS